LESFYVIAHYLFKGQCLSIERARCCYEPGGTHELADSIGTYP